MRSALLLPIVLAAMACGCGWSSDQIADGITSVSRGYQSDVDGDRLLLVPEGRFVMGSEDGGDDERPAHPVWLGSFLIDEQEVTNRQFARFVKDGGLEAVGPWRRGYEDGRGGHPVRFVTWHDAAAYCAWAGRALPTEAQWERAAKGTGERPWPWGDEWGAGLARAGLGPEEGPAPVGSFSEGASSCGALDMAGNVWEWVSDWYDRHQYEHRSTEEATRSPGGPEDGEEPEARFLETGTAAGNERSTRKVIRGGGWSGDGPYNTRTTRRSWGNPGYWFDDTGFRCALTLGRGR